MNYCKSIWNNPNLYGNFLTGNHFYNNPGMAYSHMKSEFFCFFTHLKASAQEIAKIIGHLVTIPLLTLFVLTLPLQASIGFTVKLIDKNIFVPLHNRRVKKQIAQIFQKCKPDAQHEFSVNPLGSFEVISRCELPMNDYRHDKWNLCSKPPKGVSFQKLELAGMINGQTQIGKRVSFVYWIRTKPAHWTIPNLAENCIAGIYITLK